MSPFWPEDGMNWAAIFIVLSILLAVLSRASLRDPRSHGFYRYFAWLAIVALILLNYRNLEQWFGDPLSLRQLVSWILLSASTAFVILGLLWLRSEGRPDPHRQDDQALLGIERTTRLVTTGIYKYVRHPLYSSLLLLAWGVFLKRPSWPAGGLALCASVFLVATAKVEEEENVKYFGEAYRTYMQKTQMFVPFLF